MTEEQLKRRNELYKRSGWDNGPGHCEGVAFLEGYDAGFADANVKVADLEETLARVNQTKIGEFIVYHPVLQPDEKTMVDLYVSMENQITELTRKIEVAKKALEYVRDTMCVVQVERTLEEGMTWAESGSLKVSDEALKELE